MWDKSRTSMRTKWPRESAGDVTWRDVTSGIRSVSCVGTKIVFDSCRCPVSSSCLSLYFLCVLVSFIAPWCWGPIKLAIGWKEKRFVQSRFSFVHFAMLMKWCFSISPPTGFRAQRIGAQLSECFFYCSQLFYTKYFSIDFFRSFAIDALKLLLKVFLRLVYRFSVVSFFLF